MRGTKRLKVDEGAAEARSGSDPGRGLLRVKTPKGSRRNGLIVVRLISYSLFVGAPTPRKRVRKEGTVTGVNPSDFNGGDERGWCAHDPDFAL